MNTTSILDLLFRRRPNRSAPFLRAMGLGLVATGILTSGALAQEVQVFGTLSNQPPAPGADSIPLPPSSSLSLYVWAYGGELDSPTGTECTASASGDELCGIVLNVQSSAGIVLNDFIGNPDFNTDTSSPLPFTTHIDPGARNLRTNNFDLGTPPTGMRYIGILNLDTANISGSDQVAITGEAVGANLEVRPIPLQTVALPEPSIWAALGAGVVSIAIALRRRRAQPPVAGAAPQAAH